MKSSQLTVTGIILVLMGLAFALGSPAQAAGSAVPGRSVGHVFLGMDRADVWKILGKPGLSQTVPHGMSLYGEDDWNKGDRRLTVVSERDKVIQVEFNSPRITTTDGLSTATALSQVRRRHPVMTVRLYGLEDGPDHGSEGFYIDDVKAGIAFTISTQEAVETSYLRSPPATIIVHRRGYRAVPIYEGHWSALEPPYDDPEGLHLIRSWFTPAGSRRRK